MSSPNYIVSPRVSTPCSVGKKKSKGGSRVVRGSAKKIDNTTIELSLEKLNLVNEIKDIKKEVDIIQNQIKKFAEAEEKQGDQNKGNDLKRIESLRSDIDELDYQIEFFNSFFSDSALMKLKNEINNAKLEHSNLRESINEITEKNELILAEIEGSQFVQRIQTMMELRSLTGAYSDQLKKLRKDGKKILKEAKSIQDVNPIERNKQTIIILTDELEKIKRRRGFNERYYSRDQINKQNHSEVVKTMNHKIAKKEAMDTKEKIIIKKLKESIPIDAHTLMPMDTLVQTHLTQKSDKLFEMTRVENTMV